MSLSNARRNWALPSSGRKNRPAIYDPRQLNDGLVLGLKGTMSEFELGLLRQRISRGEVLTEVPVGYVRTETNGIEKTPDRQVQEAIAEAFLQFRRLGSVRQVLLWTPRKAPAQPRPARRYWPECCAALVADASCTWHSTVSRVIIAVLVTSATEWSSACPLGAAGR